jgi:excisionase family DNA binding protein
MHKSPHSLTIGLRDAAHTLGVGETTFRKFVVEGRVPSIKFGQQYLIPKSWIASALQDAGASPEWVREVLNFPGLLVETPALRPPPRSQGPNHR